MEGNGSSFFITQSAAFFALKGVFIPPLLIRLNVRSGCEAGSGVQDAASNGEEDALDPLPDLEKDDEREVNSGTLRDLLGETVSRLFVGVY